MALEVRLRNRARATKDLDLALQGSTATGEEVRALLVESLSVDADGDRFKFRVGRRSRSRPTRPDGRAGVSAWRHASQAGSSPVCEWTWWPAPTS